MPHPQTLIELLAERTEAISEWTWAELVEFIEKHELTTKPMQSMSKDELVAIVAVHGGVFDLEPVVNELRRMKDDVARTKPRRRSKWAVAK